MQETEQTADIQKKQQEEIDKLKSELIEKERELTSMRSRAVKVYEENALMKSNDKTAAQRADMQYMLDMADRFIKSGAFNVKNAEQAYTIMKAGREMGLGEVESLNALYIVNGTINFYGKHMLARLTKFGYRTQFLDETANGVTVRVYNEDKSFDVTEKVTDRDQILLKSKAMTFAKKNKMRYHGIRMIINFHLAHHFGSVSDLLEEDYRAAEEQGLQDYETQQAIDKINAFETSEELEAYYEDNKEKISKNLNIAMAVSVARKNLEIETAEVVESETVE